MNRITKSHKELQRGRGWREREREKEKGEGIEGGREVKGLGGDMTLHH